MAHKAASSATIRRLPRYLRILHQLRAKGENVVSTSLLARKLGLDPVLVRKDLAASGGEGRPGVGFRLDELIPAIEDFIGWNNRTDAFLIGAGNLGSALLHYEGFRNYRLRIVAAFDRNPARVGKKIGDCEILDIERLPQLAHRMHINLGILTVPTHEAQNCADLMVEGGIRGIWNFTPAMLQVPNNVVVQAEDMASNLAVLSVKLDRVLHSPEGQNT